MASEILKGCKHCGARPKLSSVKMDLYPVFTYVCCRVGRKAKNEQDAAYLWNETNISCPKTYRKNNKTNSWELIDEKD